MKRIIILEFDGNIPSKKNSKRILKNRKTGNRFIASSKRHGKWHEIAMYQMNLQKVNIKDIEFPIKKCDYIHATIFYGDLRAKDNTNVIESIHDLLVDAGIIIDDNWKITGETMQTPVFREGKPGVSIIIKISEEMVSDKLRGNILNKNVNRLRRSN